MFFSIHFYFANMKAALTLTNAQLTTIMSSFDLKSARQATKLLQARIQLLERVEREKHNQGFQEITVPKSTKLSSLALNESIQNTLKARGLGTVQDLLDYGVDNLTALHRIGDRKLAMIKEALRPPANEFK
jgi:DNA-directed RNA polymerase alpha subunit